VSGFAADIVTAVAATVACGAFAGFASPAAVTVLISSLSVTAVVAVDVVSGSSECAIVFFPAPFLVAVRRPLVFMLTCKSRS
jgi:hypothetical protein